MISMCGEQSAFGEFIEDVDINVSIIDLNQQLQTYNKPSNEEVKEHTEPIFEYSEGLASYLSMDRGCIGEVSSIKPAGGRFDCSPAFDNEFSSEIRHERLMLSMLGGK